MKLLCPMIWEMHLQENTLFDLDRGVKVTRNAAQYHLYHVIYLPVKFENATSNSLGGDAFTRNIRCMYTDDNGRTLVRN